MVTETGTQVVSPWSCKWIHDWWWQKETDMVISFGPSADPAKWISSVFRISDGNPAGRWHQTQVNCPTCWNNIANNFG